MNPLLPTSLGEPTTGINLDILLPEQRLAEAAEDLRDHVRFMRNGVVNRLCEAWVSRHTCSSSWVRGGWSCPAAG